MDNVVGIFEKIKRRKNTMQNTIDTFKDEKIELLERVIKLQDTINGYKDANKRLKTRNRKLAKEIKELRESRREYDD
jgi:uncharacterized protein YaaN involved in tellurite resistance